MVLTIDSNHFIGGIGSGPKKIGSRKKASGTKEVKNDQSFENKLVEKKDQVAQTQKKAGMPQEQNFRISRQGQFIKNIAEKFEETPDVRKEKVEQIKKLIREGMYDVSPAAVAEKMLKDPETAAKLLRPII
ncbi:flagellar biosynthesis anti-sigma factor FlgM [bacterium]|nr:flagellar biosynthesis anti-sigma factor FlgM [bacterium]